MSGRGGLSLGKAAKVQAENSNASDFTKSAQYKLQQQRQKLMKNL